MSIQSVVLSIPSALRRFIVGFALLLLLLFAAAQATFAGGQTLGRYWWTDTSWPFYHEQIHDVTEWNKDHRSGIVSCPLSITVYGQTRALVVDPFRDNCWNN